MEGPDEPRCCCEERFLSEDLEDPVLPRPEKPEADREREEPPEEPPWPPRPFPLLLPPRRRPSEPPPVPS